MLRAEVANYSECSLAVTHTGYGDVRARTPRSGSDAVLIASSKRQKVARTMYYSSCFFFALADVTNVL